MKLALTLPGNQTIKVPTEVQHTIPSPGTFGLGYIGIAVGALYLTAAILALAFLVYGGIKWITSEGDPKNIQGARSMMMNAVIGLAIVFFSFLLINLIATFLGVNLLHPLQQSNPGPCNPGKPC